MVCAKRATAASKVGAAQVPPTGAYRRTQIATMMAKKSWPREAWAMVAQAGMMNRTAMPPRAAWARTTATAAQASLVGNASELRSDGQAEACPTMAGAVVGHALACRRLDCIHTARTTVSRPTSIAATRG